jgi:hypothetical protein
MRVTYLVAPFDDSNSFSSRTTELPAMRLLMMAKRSVISSTVTWMSSTLPRSRPSASTMCSLLPALTGGALFSTS